MQTSPAQLQARCRCGSGRVYKRCCLPFHQGRPGTSAEALMRSRYSAYALGLVDYILDTTDPQGPHHQPDRAAWAEQVRRFCEGTRFLGLAVLHAEERGDEAWVRFFAHLEQEGKDASFEENSHFRRAEGRWLYRAG